MLPKDTVKTRFRFLAMAILATLAVTLAVALPGVSAAGGESKNGDQSQAPPIPDKTELNYPNLGSHLDELVARVEAGQATSQDAAGDAPVHSGESVAVTIYLTGNVDTVVSYLEDNDGDPRNVGEDYIEAYVPVTLLGPVSEQPGVVRVREIVPLEPTYGDVTSQGVGAHFATAWHEAGITGQGVKMGIIDRGFEGFKDLMGTELPATVHVRCYTELGRFTTNLADCEDDEVEGDDHGTAVAETIMDIAPEASLHILHGSYSWGDLRNTIDWMISDGVSVVNRSLGGGYEGPGDGTSPYTISLLGIIDRAVENGIVFLNAAGNNANVTWFQDGPPSIHAPNGDGYGHIEFAEGDVTNSVGYRDSLSPGQQLPEGHEIWTYLRWEDTWTWPGASTDLDLYLVDSDSGEIIDRSEDDQLGEKWGIPTESLYLKIPRDGQYHLEVVYRGGNLPDWVQLSAPKVGLLEHHTDGYSINGPSESANPGMLAVGAAHYWDTHTIADYSGQGPTPDGRIKPDIVGTACGETAQNERYLRDENDCWFAGTSASSPHVAGLAALVRHRFPDYTPTQVASYLKAFAQQRETPDPNNTWGHGFARLPSPDREALVALYNATGGANWTDNTNWLTTAPIDQWHGVTTDSLGRVTELNLPFNQLKGEIPPELANLAKLKVLALDGNELTGTIPAELGSLSNLELLSLSGNQLTGEIPTELGSLANLELLSLSGNQLTGEIPTELGSLANLEELWLSENQLTGEIPVELGGPSNLVRLVLWGNELTGEIPNELGSLANLEELWLSENQLTGEIPPQLGSLANLVQLVLWGNELTGEIPNELGSLSYLERLSLSDNQLSGEIPPQLGSLANLKELHLWGNELTGEIPTDLGSLANLERMYLSSNQLTGEIPPQLGSLANLVVLGLSNNQLSGEIPAEMSGLANLEELYLSSNQLTGEIPAEMSGLTNLEELYLSSNQLTGEIPPQLGSLANLKELYLWGNELTGEIPAELGSLANLEQLYLSGNQLTGEIPTELGSLANLERMYLSGNQLTGEIPPQLGSLANLVVLDLSINQLSGTVPQTLAGLTALQSFAFHNNQGLCAPIDEAFQTWLRSISALGSSCAPADSQEDRAVLVQVHSATGGADWVNNSNWLSENLTREWWGVTNDANGRVHGLFLSGNWLSGEIPSELGSLAKLEWLSFNHNQLTGEIPSELGDLVNLRALSLAENRLTGEIPVELGRLMNLTVLQLSGNQLTGCVPANLQDVPSNDFDQLGLPFCPGGDPLIARYDTNGDGAIDIGELFTAIDDYFAGEIGIGELFTLIDLYFAGPN